MVSLENMSLDITVTIVDNSTGLKAGQLRYIIKGSRAEIFDTYVFPDYRRKKLMSNLLKRVTPELKMSGVTKMKLKYFDEGARIAWEKMGFREIGRSGHMELDII